MGIYRAHAGCSLEHTHTHRAHTHTGHIQSQDGEKQCDGAGSCSPAAGSTLHLLEVCRR